MVFYPTATTQRLQEWADGTSINTNHLAYTWKVEMKGEDSIIEGGGNVREGLRNKEKKHCSIKN